MAEKQSYCDYAATLATDDVHRVYHDSVYGFPVTDDSELFERLVLEINQAGLSWTTILRKQENFRRAYSEFEIAAVAAYEPKDVRRLLSDPGIIRNRLKVAAAIHNAQKIRELQKKHGSFRNWLEEHRGAALDAWIKLFKSHFKFTGGEIVREFLLSTGFLPGAHDLECSIYTKIPHQV